VAEEREDLEADRTVLQNAVQRLSTLAAAVADRAQEAQTEREQALEARQQVEDEQKDVKQRRRGMHSERLAIARERYALEQERIARSQYASLPSADQNQQGEREQPRRKKAGRSMTHRTLVQSVTQARDELRRYRRSNVEAFIASLGQPQSHATQHVEVNGAHEPDVSSTFTPNDVV
jgi:chromosome segregation ATPase